MFLHVVLAWESLLLLAPHITPTRQEVFFFGTAAGDLRFTEAQLPVWIDNGKHLFYGIPGNHWRGFKIADDTRGPVIDPTTMERQISAEGLAAARSYLRLRFPALADAPLAESRVCQYEKLHGSKFHIGPPSRSGKCLDRWRRGPATASSMVRL